MVAINLNSKQSRRGGEGREEQERTGKGDGGGSGRLLDEGGVKTEYPRRWYNRNGYKVSNLTK